MKSQLISTSLLVFLAVPQVVAQNFGKPEDMQQVALVSQQAILNYFEGSDRRVEQIRIGRFTSLSSKIKNYLVEADVKAQSALDARIIPYHCGVFVKKLNNYKEWQIQYTDCESISLH